MTNTAEQPVSFKTEDNLELEGADHFFSNRLEELKASIDELLHI